MNKTTTVHTGSAHLTLFKSLDRLNQGFIYKADIITAIESTGLRQSNPRLKSLFSQLKAISDTMAIDVKQFTALIEPRLTLVEKALRSQLIVPEFNEFTQDISLIFHETNENKQGKVADYIPQLSKVDPDKFAVGLCTVDGQQFSLGDSEELFCTQSTCKPITYCLALEEHGLDKVHQHIGQEPSGVAFNELKLNAQGRPHNPMINAGAIVASALIKAGLSNAERFDFVLSKWKELSGGHPIGFNNSIYLSERESADRNFALGYFMRENGAFPPNTDVAQTLEFYFQCCSIELNVQSMAIIASALANAGVCPLTDQRIFQPDTVKNCLSLMYSCGMYDFSGQWAFSIGLPAKSGVSGAIMLVIPDLLGMCIWAPPLDELGNSVKGVEFCQRLLAQYNFHNYDSLTNAEHKKDPRRTHHQLRLSPTLLLLDAASRGDLSTISQLVANNVDLNSADYDGRTALHLAAAEGKSDVVTYLLRHGADAQAVDRWGNIPLRDAVNNQHQVIINLLSPKD